VTTRILRRNGYQVLEAATGPEAVTMAASQPCQLLLTDVVMPVMSGREVAGAIARHRPNLPVLYMSGYSEGVLGPHRALDEGVDLIQKPFNERALLTKVRAALDAVSAHVGQSGGVQ
jgi:CheY-like chemotaxis protein